MPTIALVPGTLVAHAAYAGAAADVNALSAPGRALEGFGQSIGQVGGVLEQFAIRKQNAINAADVMTGQLAMDKAKAAYQDELARNQDPDTWVPNWQQRVQDLKGEVLTEKLAPVVKEHLSNQFNEFASQSTSQINTQAQVRTIQDQKAKMMVFANTFWDAGDFEKGEFAADQMKEHGLINDVQHAELLQKGRVQVDFANVTHAAAKDPIQTLDALEAQEGGKWQNFTDLDENQRASLRNRVESQVNKLRTDTLQSLYDRQNGGEVLLAPDLQKMVDAKTLNAGQMKAILASQAAALRRGQLVPPSAGAYSQLLSLVDGYDPAMDRERNFAGRAAIVAEMAALPEVYRTEVKQALDRRINNTGESQKTVDAFAYLRSVVGLGTLGNVKQDAGGPIDQKGAEEAYRREAIIRGELTSKVMKNPDMSTAEQLQFIAEKVSVFTTQASGKPILNALSGTSSKTPVTIPEITTPEQLQALPSGTLFRANGRTYKAK